MYAENQIPRDVTLRPNDFHYFTNRCNSSFTFMFLVGDLDCFHHTLVFVKHLKWRLFADLWKSYQVMPGFEVVKI